MTFARHFAVAAFAAISSIHGAAAAPITVDGFSTPESVLCRDGRCYVSNIGATLKPLDKDGDGFLSVFDEADGHIVEGKAFPAGEAPALNAPKGLALVDGRIYTADIDRVVGFDLASGAQVFEATLSGNGPLLLNDLAVEDDRTLLVSDTLGNVVYRLALETGTFVPLALDIPGANGIVVDAAGGTAYVAAIGDKFSGGDVYAVDLAGNTPPRVVARRHGLLDGIAQLANGDLLISDWVALDRPAAGRLERVTLDGTVTGQPLDGPAIHGPADFCYDARTGRLWMPATLDNRVVGLDVKP